VDGGEGEAREVVEEVVEEVISMSISLFGGRQSRNSIWEMGLLFIREHVKWSAITILRRYDSVCTFVKYA